MATAVRTRQVRDEEQARFPAGHTFDGGGLQQFARNLRTHRVFLALDCRPTITCAGNLLRFGPEHVDADIYIVPRRVGIRANLVCKIDHLPRLRWVEILQTNPKLSNNAEPTFCAWSNPNGSGDRRIGRNPDLQLLPATLMAPMKHAA